MTTSPSSIESVVITVNSPDRPGVIQALSQAVRVQGGNWTESNFSALEGRFAGIVKIEIAEEKKSALLSALESLSASGIDICYHPPEGNSAPAQANKTVALRLDANDREGIIEEITTALAGANINIVNLESSCESASMVGYDLFSAEILANLPESLSQGDLIALLEHISDDVMVTIVEQGF